MGDAALIELGWNVAMLWLFWACVAVGFWAVGFPWNYAGDIEFLDHLLSLVPFIAFLGFPFYVMAVLASWCATCTEKGKQMRCQDAIRESADTSHRLDVEVGWWGKACKQSMGTAGGLSRRRRW